MLDPKFKQGDRISYDGRTGTIETVINRRDQQDTRIQGFRYEVSFAKGAELWSIPERCLRANMSFRACQND